MVVAVMRTVLRSIGDAHRGATLQPSSDNDCNAMGKRPGGAGDSWTRDSGALGDSCVAITGHAGGLMRRGFGCGSVCTNALAGRNDERIGRDLRVKPMTAVVVSAEAIRAN
ncbi:hypothetical protein HDU96_004439, partial [Phlyctochytrium bullatum]